MAELHPVIALELQALAAWCKGDPTPFLELSAPDVSYFDPYRPERVDGHAALTAIYEALRGQIFAAYHEMIDPSVTEIGDAAVLTYRFNSWNDDPAKALRWNCTEVFRRDPEGWRIVQTHWSYTTPSL
jgi:hypothetical protein